MHPIAIVSILGAVGFAVYKFIKQPTIDIERDAKTPGEKALEEADKLLGNAFQLVDNIVSGVNEFIDPKGSVNGLSYTGNFINDIWNNRANNKSVREYFKNLNSRYTQAYKNAMGTTKESGPTFEYGTAGMLRAIASDLELSAAKINANTLFGEWGKIKGSIIDFQNCHAKTIQDNKYIYNNIKTISNPIKRFYGQNENESMWRFYPSSVNAFPVFTNLAIFSPFSGANINQPYYFYCLFPANRRCHVIVVRVQENQITEFHQVRIGNIGTNNKHHIAKMAMFADFNRIFEGFLVKKDKTGKTFSRD